MNSFPQRVAIVYDRMNSEGGAERVLQIFHSLYPQAPFFTSVWDQKKAPWSKDYDVHTSFLQHWRWARNHHQFFGWLMPFIFENFDFSNFDIIISVTSEAAKGVITKPEQLHICYLLTPTRYLWSHEKEYREEFPFWLQSLVKKLQTWLKKWDWVSARRPDVLIPISQLIQKRVKKYYDLNAESPLYPPLTKFPPAQKPTFIPNEKFFLSWGRHTQYKAFDVVIRACIRQKQTLVLLGEGPDSVRLHRLASKLDPQKKYIYFLGKVKDAELSWYIQNAQAAIFPQIEDFGLTIVEAITKGCPVIVHQDSGAAELLQNGKEGIFLSATTQSEIERAMIEIQRKTWPRLDRDAWSREYAVAAFRQRWLKKTSVLWAEHERQLKGNL